MSSLAHLDIWRRPLAAESRSFTRQPADQLLAGLMQQHLHHRDARGILCHARSKPYGLTTEQSSAPSQPHFSVSIRDASEPRTCGQVGQPHLDPQADKRHCAIIRHIVPAIGAQPLRAAPAPQLFAARLCQRTVAAVRLVPDDARRGVQLQQAAGVDISGKAASQNQPSVQKFWTSRRLRAL